MGNEVDHLIFDLSFILFLQKGGIYILFLSFVYIYKNLISLIIYKNNNNINLNFHIKIEKFLENEIDKFEF